MKFEFVFRKPKHRNAPTSDFSEFVIRAKSAEQKKVLTRVVMAANEDQKRTVERARKSSQGQIAQQPAY